MGGVEPAVLAVGDVEGDPAGFGEPDFCPAVGAPVVGEAGVIGVRDAADEACGDADAAEHGDEEAGEFVADALAVVEDPACALDGFGGERAEVVVDVVFDPAGDARRDEERVVVLACEFVCEVADLAVVGVDLVRGGEVRSCFVGEIGVRVECLRLDAWIGIHRFRYRLSVVGERPRYDVFPAEPDHVVRDVGLWSRGEVEDVLSCSRAGVESEFGEHVVEFVFCFAFLDVDAGVDVGGDGEAGGIVVRAGEDGWGDECCEEDDECDAGCRCRGSGGMCV